MARGENLGLDVKCNGWERDGEREGEREGVHHEEHGYALSRIFRGLGFVLVVELG